MAFQSGIPKWHSILEKVNHQKFKEDDANEQLNLAKNDLKKSRDDFKGMNPPSPDQDDEPVEFNKWRSHGNLATACEIQMGELQGWEDELKKRGGLFVPGMFPYLSSSHGENTPIH